MSPELEISAVEKTSESSPSSRARKLARAFLDLESEKAKAKYPELVFAYAAIEAHRVQVTATGISEHLQNTVIERFKKSTADNIAKGRMPLLLPKGVRKAQGKP